MMDVVGNVNRGVHHAVAQLVASYLADAGLGTTPKPYVPRGSKISDTIAANLENGVDSDVRGLADVFVNVTSRQDFKPWIDLDRARIGADLTGKPLAAFCQWRSGRPVGDALVVLSLADFAQLVGGSPPTS